MKKTLKRLCTGFLALATVVTAFTDYTRSCRKQAILDGKCRACRYR